MPIRLNKSRGRPFKFYIGRALVFLGALIIVTPFFAYFDLFIRPPRHYSTSPPVPRSVGADLMELGVIAILLGLLIVYAGYGINYGWRGSRFIAGIAFLCTGIGVLWIYFSKLSSSGLLFGLVCLEAVFLSVVIYLYYDYVKQKRALSSSLSEASSEPDGQSYLLADPSRVSVMSRGSANSKQPSPLAVPIIIAVSFLGFGVLVIIWSITDYKPHPLGLFWGIVISAVGGLGALRAAVSLFKRKRFA
jgi:hypothetical protein